MNFLKMPCAGILGKCPKTLHRFHWSCLKCRWRWQHKGKWTNPPYWITFMVIWFFKHSCEKDRVVVANLLIDPRGHFTRLRCMAIVTLLKLAEFFPMRLPNNCGCSHCYPDQQVARFFRPRKYFLTACEFIATITI